MSWVKLDDQFPYHHKIISAGLDGRALYITALCYVANQLTDGFVPQTVIPVLGALAGIEDAKQTASKLLDICLWDACDNGYMIHDYLDYNPTREEVIKTREARREAGSLGGTRSSEAKRQANAEAKGKQKASKSQPRTRTPTPSLDSSKEESSSTPKEWMNALYNLCGVDVSLASAGMRKRISETGKALIKSGAKLEDVERFANWWISDDWRKKNNPIPTPEKVRDNWTKMNGNGKHNGTSGRSSEPDYTADDYALAEEINRRRAETLKAAGLK